MAVMADFAKLPRRQKFMLFGVIAVALGLLYNQFVLKKLKANLADAEGEHEQSSPTTAGSSTTSPSSRSSKRAWSISIA